ncbi:MAG: hypothetical protein GX061_00550 [Eubacteriaceae bacterium]|nr:hypothetical protein [Eubacteriaceae bacterium]
MNHLKKLLCLLLAVGITFSAAGCAFLSLNESKDAKSVVASIEGNDVLKEDFLKYYKIVLMIYDLNNYTTPTDAEEQKEYRSAVFEDFVRVCALEYYCKENSVTAEDDVTEQRDEFITSMKGVYDTDEKYLEYLKKMGFETEEAFKEALDYYMGLTINSNAFYKRSEDKSFLFSDKGAFTVGEKVVSGQEFYYYTIMVFMQIYLSYQSYPTADADQLTYYERIKTDYLGYYFALAEYAREQGLTVTAEEIAAQLSAFDYYESYLGEATYDSLYQQYFISEQDEAAARASIGEAMALTQKYKDMLIGQMEVSEENLAAYYETNKSDFGPFASAYYISFESMESANEYKEKINGDKKAFDKLYTEVQGGEVETLEAKHIDSLTKGEIEDSVLAEALFNLKEGEVYGIIPGVNSELFYIACLEKITPAYDYSDPEDKEVIKAAYIEDNKDTYAEGLMDAVYDEYTITDGDYYNTPSQRLKTWLFDTLNIKKYEKRAIR